MDLSCLQGTFVPYCRCVPVHFWKTYFYMYDWECVTAILFVTLYVYIIRLWTCFSRIDCAVGFYMMSIIFMIARSRNLIFYARLCCISTWCHDIHLLRALQQLYIYACHVVYGSVWANGVPMVWHHGKIANYKNGRFYYFHTRTRPYMTIW